MNIQERIKKINAAVAVIEERYGGPDNSGIGVHEALVGLSVCAKELAAIAENLVYRLSLTDAFNKAGSEAFVSRWVVDDGNPPRPEDKIPFNPRSETP